MCSYFYFANTELCPALCQAPGVPTSFREHCKLLAVLRITKPQIHRSEGLSGGCFIAGEKSTEPVTNWIQSVIIGSWQSVKLLGTTLALLKLPDKAAEQSFLPQTLYFPLFLWGFPQSIRGNTWKRERDRKKKRGFPQVDKHMVNHRTNPKWFGLEGILKIILFPSLENLLEYPRAISIGFKPSLEMYQMPAQISDAWGPIPHSVPPFPSDHLQFPSLWRFWKSWNSFILFSGMKTLHFLCEAGWNPLKNKLWKMQIRTRWGGWEATTLLGAGKGTEVNFESLLIILHSSSSKHFTESW